MSLFKQQLAKDAKMVFMNPCEFGKMKLIDNREIAIIVDDDLLQERRAKANNPSDGVYNASFLFHALKQDFEKKPVIGKPMKIDARQFLVADVQEDDAMYTITLSRNSS